MTNPIDTVFADLKSRKRRAFIPFLTAGDPDLTATRTLAGILANNGADLIEIGFPYSDPIADGPVIQASYTRALAHGLKIDDLFACVRSIADDLSGKVPLVGMTSFSLVYRKGTVAFLSQARTAGFSGLIVPDLPVDESQTLEQECAGADLKLIHLVTPTTPDERAARIADRSSGFLYCVSITGITGERSELPAALLDRLRWLRGRTALPLCVGFGISRADQVRMLRDHVDGVIVGSAFVRKLEQGGTVEEMGVKMADLARDLSEALNG